MKTIFIMSALFLSITTSISAYADTWDGYVIGKIKDVSVAEAENYGFRITLEGSPKMCINNLPAGADLTNEPIWAYLNKSDSNYETYVSVLLSAKLSNSDVLIYSQKELSTGRCHIGYITLR